MRQALSPKQVKSVAAGGGTSRWALLPRLCNLAAGGGLEGVEEVTLAWLLFYAAAHLMDSVQDNDQPEPWWEGRGPGVALNAASGLYFSAALVLNKLSQQEPLRAAGLDISEDFYRGFLQMCNGQHLDLTCTELTLDQYWQQAALKSGTFFALACRAGARLATGDRGRLEAYRRLGHHLGVIVQIKDDLDDVLPPEDTSGSAGQKATMRKSLPAVYALAVLPAAERDRLRALLAEAPHHELSAKEALGIIDKTGAGVYIEMEIVRHRQEALKALISAGPRSPAKEELSALLESF